MSGARAEHLVRDQAGARCVGGYLDPLRLPDRQNEPVQPDTLSSHLLTEARRHDPDRYLCALLAPAERRDALLTLILFNHELGRIPEVVSQPMAGMIRLQWWREAVDELGSGRPARRHPVVEALAVVLGAGLAEPQALQALIDAREPALERIAPDMVALKGYAAATSGALHAITYALLGGKNPTEAAGAAAIGTAFGLVGLASALRREAERSAEAGSSEVMAPLCDALRAGAAERLRAGRALAGRPARKHMAAFLPAALTDTYLRRWQHRPAAGLARPATMPLLLAARALARRP